MKNCYVTGATGCVGRNLVDELIKENWNVIVLHRKSSDLSRLKGIQVKFQEIDLFDITSVRQNISENSNAIFHVAGNTSHWSAEIEQQWKDNVLATRNLVQIALEKKIQKFIFTSTGATLSYQDFNEKQSNQIYPPYVRTKRQAELEVSAGIAKGLNAVILHPIIVIGAYDYNSYSQIFIDIAKSRFNFAFPGRIVFCHARDVAKAHIQAFENGKNGAHYELGGTHTTWVEVFQKIATVVGNSNKVRVAPIFLLKLASHIFSLTSFFTKKKPLLTPELVDLIHDTTDVSIEDKIKAEKDLGYQSGSLDSMIQECYEWLVSEKLLKRKLSVKNEKDFQQLNSNKAGLLK